MKLFNKYKDLINGLILTVFMAGIIFNNIKIDDKFINIDNKINDFNNKLENKFIDINNKIDDINKQSFKNIRNRTENSIFLIISKDGGMGTAFQVMWNKNKYIITNAHICNDFKIVYLYKGKSYIEIKSKKLKPYIRSVVYTNRNFDLCVIRGIDKYPYLKLNNKRGNIGEKIALIGHPGGNKLNVSIGDIVDNNYQFERMDNNIDGCNKKYRDRCIREHKNILQTNAFMVPGSSGSPVVNLDCKVIGVAAWYYRGTFWSSLVPLNHLKFVLNKINKK